MSTEGLPTLPLSHYGFVARFSQGLLGEHPAQRLHILVPVHYCVVGAYHVDGISGAGLDQGLYGLGKLLLRSTVGCHRLSLPDRTYLHRLRSSSANLPRSVSHKAALMYHMAVCI